MRTFVLLNNLIQILNLHRVIPFGEVEVSATPLDLATLEIDGFATRIYLLGVEGHSVVGIDNHTPRIHSAEEVVALGLAVGVLGYSERLVNRYPAVGFEVNNAPIVQIPPRRVHHKTTLPMCRDATYTAQRHKQ